jgi:hypothetical protein
MFKALPPEKVQEVLESHDTESTFLDTLMFLGGFTIFPKFPKKLLRIILNWYDKKKNGAVFEIWRQTAIETIKDNSLSYPLIIYLELTAPITYKEKGYYETVAEFVDSYENYKNNLYTL